MEDLAYRRLLDVYYMHEKALPADVKKTARLARMSDTVEVLQAVLEEFFVLSDDGWHSKRADAELTSMHAKQEQQSSKDAHEAERMKRYRERRSEMFAALRLVQIVPAWDVPMKDLQRLFDTNCNGHATDLQREQVPNCNANATAIPTPTPTPTPKNKEKRADAPVFPDWVPVEAWNGYVEMRRKIKKPMTDRAIKLRLGELEKFRTSGYDLAPILDKSTVNNWTDLYPPKLAAGLPQAAKTDWSAKPEWVMKAGFSDIADAGASMCTERNAHEFKNGKRLEVSP